MNHLAKNTDVPGKFSYTSERECCKNPDTACSVLQACFNIIIYLTLSGWGNVNDMRMVDVKYDEYALIHTIKTKGDEFTVVNKLYGTVLISHHSVQLIKMCYSHCSRLTLRVYRTCGRPQR